ncbi:MAG: hypothetical protein RBT01_14440 [Anaerolineaceae bacterium]|nr:hypothetical protein [Anaerolineaceae bacterium]
MPDGVPVSRQFVLITQKGNCVVDWGNNVYQDIYTGEKIILADNEFTYSVKEIELMMLKQYGIINDFDQVTVYVYPMSDIHG